jgi:hypothetical protein
VTLRTAHRLAWGTCALALAMMAATAVLAVLNRADSGNLSYSAIVGVSTVAVGGVVASRRPANPVGWLFLGGALFVSLQALTAEYAIYGIITNPDALPLAETMAGLSNTIEVIGPLLIFVLVPLYFPNGRPVSWRWGVVAWLALALLPVITVLRAVSMGEAVYGSGIPNPWRVEALRPVTEIFGPVGLVYYIGLIFASAASLAVRFWRSRGVERQQIKWLTFAAAFIPVWFVTNGPIDRAFPALFAVLDALVIAGVPVAAGIAILRYRLYDIDRIINRTLVYAALTAMLAALYLGGVVVLQYALRGLTGGETQLAVVASTLAIAALFSPLRRRIQAFIDRRFYRKKYDARKTLEALSTRLRDETDLNEISEDVASVVRETLQPEHVSLWLRPAQTAGSRGRVGETRG